MLTNKEIEEITPTEEALGVAARAWCLTTTENITMDVALAKAFAQIIDHYREALIWCSGSNDFAVDGQARKGWEKLCVPLLD